MKKIFLSTTYIYLFILSLWLDLLTRNYRQFDFYSAIRSILIFMSIFLFLIIILQLLTKNLYRVGFCVFVLSVLIFLPGQFITVLEYNLKFTLNKDFLTFFLIAIFMLSFVLFSRRFWSFIRNEKMVAVYLNLVLFINLFFSLSKFLLLQINPTDTEVVTLEAVSEGIIENHPISSRYIPDIYYVILDGYGRSDVLSNIYGLDNQIFLDGLEERGFVIANQSSSNYLQTALSISSSLNLNYLQDLLIFNRHSDDREPVKNLISDSITRNILKMKGYRFVAYDTGYYFTDIKDADEYISFFWNLNYFEQLLITQSIFGLIDKLISLPVPFYDYETHRRRITYSFEQIVRSTTTSAPKFIFVHIPAPHPPFVFDAQGDAIQADRPFSTLDASQFLGTTDEYIKGYTQQVLFINTEILSLVDRIIDQSAIPPIIIIQADHGPRLYMDVSKPENTCIKESSSILNAYYVPEEFRNKIYPEITPVNTFRLIFSELFDLNLNLLPDKTYYSSFQFPYDFVDVTSQKNSDCVQLKP